MQGEKIEKEREEKSYYFSQVNQTFSELSTILLDTVQAGQSHSP